MTNINENFNNYMNLSNNICNLKNIPTSWQKFGEVFCKSEEPIFVCSICLKNAESINTAYTTSDGSTFWWHIQQYHISVEFETIDKVSAEIENFDTESVDSEISYGEITTRGNENLDFADETMKQNSVKLLEELHESIVNGKSETAQCVDVSKDNTQSLNQITEENSTKEDIKPNAENKFINYSNLNFYYDENETYTISDDDDEEEEIADMKFPLTNKELDVINNLTENEMIEISDDELSEDNIETRPSSPIAVDKENRCIEESDHSKTHKLSKSSEAEESNDHRTSFPYGVPTPDISPSGHENSSNLNCNQLNYNLMVNNNGESIKQTRKYTKKTVKPYLAVQCELCGVRTANANTMKNHLQRFHYSVLQQLGTTDCHQHYRQLQQPYQNKQQNGFSQKTLKRPFKCKSCKRRTITLKSMERHQQLYHGPEANFLTKQCNICHKRILRETFELHMKKHFSTEFSCKYCGVVYKYKQSINSHIKKYHADRNLYIAPEYLPQFETNPNVNYVSPENTSHAQHENQQFWTHFTNIINNI